MKRRLILSVLAAVMAALWAPAAWGQLTSVRGYVHDVQGNPLPGVTVQLLGHDTGRKYDIKTNKKGEYFSLGITSGKYDLSVLKDGQLIYKITGVPILLGEKDNIINVDLKQEQAAQEAALPPEVKKQQEEQQKEVTKLKSLNDKLAAAKAAQDAGNPQQAVTILTESTQIDPSQPVIWAALAEAQRVAAVKLTDAAEKKAAYAGAVASYQKAIALKPTGSYYNNMADAAAHAGDSQAAIQAYDEAVKIDPANAAQYYFNEGAVLTNTGKLDEAIQAFDKTIQADPNKAEAYYWKGVNLLSKATLKGSKMEAPPGTAEAFNKYLELQPTGQFAEPAKQMLAQIGASVETSFGKAKGKPKK